MKRKLVVWGAGMQARVVGDIVRQQGVYQLVGFIDSVNPHRKGEPFAGAAVLGGREQLEPLLQQGVTHLIFGFGHNSSRLRLAEEVALLGYSLATAIHPDASVAPDVTLGPGCVVKAGAVVDTAVQIGANVMLSPNTTVSHGSILEDGVRLSAGAQLGGSVHVKRGAWLAVGVSVKPQIVIGEGAMIGIGSVVLSDIPAHTVAYGVPAKAVRPTRKHEN